MATKEITSISKATAKLLHQEINDAVKAVGARYGLVLQGSNGSYAEDRFSTKVTLAVDLTKNPPKDILPITNEALRMGLAKRGTQVEAMHRGRMTVCTIVNARRTKYEVKFVGEENGWLYPFAGVRLLNPAPSPTHSQLILTAPPTAPTMVGDAR